MCFLLCTSESRSAVCLNLYFPESLVPEISNAHQSTFFISKLLSIRIHIMVRKLCPLRQKKIIQMYSLSDKSDTNDLNLWQENIQKLCPLSDKNYIQMCPLSEKEWYNCATLGQKLYKCVHCQTKNVPTQKKMVQMSRSYKIFTNVMPTLKTKIIQTSCPLSDKIATKVLPTLRQKLYKCANS